MLKCLFCSVDLKSKHAKKFCGRSCAAKYNNTRREINPKCWDHLRTLKICKQCNIPYKKDRKSKYCTDSCKNESRIIKLRAKSKGLPCKAPWEGAYYYLVLSKDNRNRVYIYKDSQYIIGTSYARYLMSIHLGRLLERDEDVDHINNDKTDDRIENLQILSHLKNCTKHSVEVLKGRLVMELLCPCGVKFIREKRNVRLNNIDNKIFAYCSKSCAGMYNINKNEYSTILLREFKTFSK